MSDPERESNLANTAELIRADVLIGELRARVRELETWQTEIRISLKIGETSLASAIGIADAGLKPQGAPPCPKGHPPETCRIVCGEGRDR